MRVGERLGPHRFPPLTRTDFVRYAGASGDLNPIHHDETAALAAGLPAVMAPGMLSAGLLASAVVRWTGAGRLLAFAVRFREPVWPGDRLSAEADVTAVRPGEADLALRLVAADGRAVVTGTATVATDQAPNGSPTGRNESTGG